MKEYNKGYKKTPFRVYSEQIKDWESLLDLKFPTTYFVLFLAADFTEIRPEKILKIGEHLINKGLLYICCWGPKCSNAHFHFDSANIDWEEKHKRRHHVTSIDYEDEKVEEAIWFCLFNATPDDEYWEACSTIVLNVGEIIEPDFLEKMLSDIDALDDIVVNN